MTETKIEKLTHKKYKLWCKASDKYKLDDKRCIKASKAFGDVLQLWTKELQERKSS